MRKHRTVPMKASEYFDKELGEIIRERFGKGIDKKPLSRRRIQEGIIRHSDWKIMKEDLKSARMEDES